MARYRKIDPRIWNDAKFRALTDAGKLAFLFTLTHPHMTALGAMRASVPGLASEIGWTPKAFQEAFHEALSKGMAEHDEEACFVWLPNFLKYNLPESPNVVKAWSASLDLIPECDLKNKAIQSAKDLAEGMSEAFAKALPEAFAKALPKPMPYQEQEQEQKQKYNVRPISGLAERGRKRGMKSQLPDDWIPTGKTIDRLSDEFGLRVPEDTDRYVAAFRDACKAKGYEYADFDAAFSNCVRQDWPKLRNGATKMQAEKRLAV